MSEVLGILGLEVLTSLLLGTALLLACFGAGRWRTRSGLDKARFLAAIALCLVWANWILGYSLGPRYLHGSALADGAGQGADGIYYVVDPYGKPTGVSEEDFWQRRHYEAGSVALPWYVTPVAVLVLIAGLLRAKST